MYEARLCCQLALWVAIELQICRFKLIHAAARTVEREYVEQEPALRYAASLAVEFLCGECIQRIDCYMCWGFFLAVSMNLVCCQILWYICPARPNEWISPALQVAASMRHYLGILSDCRGVWSEWKKSEETSQIEKELVLVIDCRYSIIICESCEALGVIMSLVRKGEETWPEREKRSRKVMDVKCRTSTSWAIGLDPPFIEGWTIHSSIIQNRSTERRNGLHNH